MAVVLVVDDDSELVQLLQSILSRAGYLTDSALDGVEAVLKVIKGRFDAVLMDVKMPRLDGIDALQIMRALNPDLPVIVFTGGPTQAEIEESKRLGATNFLVKPLKNAELVDSLRVALLNLANLGLPRD